MRLFKPLCWTICLLLCGALGSGAAPAIDYSQFHWKDAGRIVVQAGGRIKPLDTFARELVAQTTGQACYAGQNPVQTYFLWMADGEAWSTQQLIYLPKGELRRALKLDAHPGNRFALRELADQPEVMRMALEGQAREQAGGRPNFIQSKALDLLNRMGGLSGVCSHENPLLVPTGSNPEVTWRSMAALMSDLSDSTRGDSVNGKPPVSDTLSTLALAFAGLYNSVREGNAEIFNTAVSVFRDAQQAAMGNAPQVQARLEAEEFYNHFQPFFWARGLLLAGLALFALSLKPSLARWKSAGLAGLLGGLLLYTAGLGLRAYVAGRAPWSNMYESLLAIGWAAVVIAVIYELIRRDRVFGLVGAAMGVVALSVAQFAGLDRGINPLVPALQSYWLNYHVIITLSGYAAFALTMGIGHAVLIAGVRSQGAVTPGLAQLAKANLRIMQVGCLLLVTGILLGAVWANVSWGRFWGWDPKETWALICWFVYIAFLHGRAAGWLGWRGLAAYSVGAFPVVIMTYYGVNYFLSGLHSYGAGSAPGIPWQLFVYLGLEGLFLGWALAKLKGKIPRRPGKQKLVPEATRPATPTS